jgi:hypothetical protein
MFNVIDKYAYIDAGIVIPVRTGDLTAVTNFTTIPITNLQVVPNVSWNGVTNITKLQVTWTGHSTIGNAEKYKLAWFNDTGIINTALALTSPSYDILNPIAGRYTISVTAVHGITEIETTPVTLVYEYKLNNVSTLLPPVNPSVIGSSSLTISSLNFKLAWEYNTGNDTVLDKLVNYLVEVYDEVPAGLIHSYTVNPLTNSNGTLLLSYDEIFTIFSAYPRKITFKVFSRDTFGFKSTLCLTFTVENPVPAAQSFTLTPLANAVIITIATTTDTDGVGYHIYTSLTSGGVRTLVYSGTERTVTIPCLETTPVLKYYTVDAYDTLGTIGLVTSSEQSATALVTSAIASNITNTPAGNIASTTIQAAINELDSEKEAIANKVIAWSSPTDVQYPSAKLVNDTFANYVPLSSYHIYYLGKYPSLVALQTAHATGTSGDYAQVDTGAGSNVINYNWDAEDGWVVGSSGSGASNTDALPEGTTNLYFTETRARATLLTGYSITTGTIGSTDSILTAFDKVAGNTLALQTINTDTMNPTGFVSPELVVINYDSVTRTVTLTGTLDYYYRGVKKTLGASWTSSAHSATAGGYFLSSSDGTTFTWATTPFNFYDVLVTYVILSTTPAYNFGIRESHGCMDWNAHQNDHINIGTYRKSGGLVTAGTYTENIGSTAAVTPSFDAAIILDEDNQTTIPALPQGNYTTMYIGVGGLCTFDTTATVPFIAATAAIMQVNNPITGLMTPAVNNRYYNVYQILIPTTSDVNSQKYRMVFLQPQATYTSLAAAQAESVGSLSFGNLATLATEFCLFTRITYQVFSGDTHTGKNRIPVGGISYVSNTRSTTITLPVIQASNIPATPSGSLVGVNVQDIVDELELNKLSIANIHAATNKVTPVDADEFGIYDSITGLLNKLTWANLKATLKTYFDTLYSPTWQTWTPTFTGLTLGNAVVNGKYIILPNKVCIAYLDITVGSTTTATGVNQYFTLPAASVSRIAWAALGDGTVYRSDTTALYKQNVAYKNTTEAYVMWSVSNTSTNACYLTYVIVGAAVGSTMCYKLEYAVA